VSRTGSGGGPIPLSDIIWGTLPFVILMAVAILLLCLMPGIALWLLTIGLPGTAARNPRTARR
jgi:TRAP-type C4-dicarboxylate transport system permease large subunit